MGMNLCRNTALILGLMAMLAGCHQGYRQPSTVSAAPNAMVESKVGRQLGTKWGEDVSSQVVTVNATRLRSSPNRIITIYYNDAKSDGQQKIELIPLSSVDMSIQDQRGRNMTLKQRGGSEYTLAAQEGERYQLYFFNRSRDTTYEVVATVDGLDVLSGQPGSLSRSGYLIRPNSSLTIEGFRKSEAAVAAFRFARPDESYAANSVAGDVQNTGVIGVALFEMEPERLPDCQPQAFPQDSRYAPAPCKKR